MSKNPIKKKIYQLVIFSAIIAAMGAVFQWITNYYELQIASPAIPVIIFFFFCITLFTLYFVFKAPSNKKFIFSYMLSRIIKMAAILLFFVLYIIYFQEDRWNFAVAFLIIYFSYSIFEVVALKKNNEKSIP
jgi:hypothetical protein